MTIDNGMKDASCIIGNKTMMPPIYNCMSQHIQNMHTSVQKSALFKWHLPLHIF